jgi:hypothetical protein
MQTQAIGVMTDTTFLIYVAVLVLSGLLLLAVAIWGLGTGSVVLRVLYGLIAAGLLGYAVYLYFLFRAGTVHVFVYVLILPVLPLFQAVRAWWISRRGGPVVRAKPKGYPYPFLPSANELGHPLPGQPGPPTPVPPQVAQPFLQESPPATPAIPVPPPVPPAQFQPPEQPPYPGGSTG